MVVADFSGASVTLKKVIKNLVQKLPTQRRRSILTRLADMQEHIHRLESEPHPSSDMLRLLALNAARAQRKYLLGKCDRLAIEAIINSTRKMPTNQAAQ